jgi:hypothetical protein
MSTEGPYNYSSSSTQRSATEFNFVQSRNGTEVLPSPVSVESADQTGRLTLTVTSGAAVANISSSVSGGIPTPPNAVLTLGVPASPVAVQVFNNAGNTSDELVVGRSAVSGVAIASAGAFGGGGVIQMNSAVGTETLSLGANGAYFDTVKLGPAALITLAQPPSLKSSFSVTPQVANGTGTILGNSGVVITAPLTAGLYLVAASCSSADGPSVASQISAVCYYNGATWSTGGVAIANVGTGGVSLSPAPTTRATINFFNNSGGNLVNMSFITLPLFKGAITGMI